MGDDPYTGRKQTELKHQILKRYLLKFALIIGQHWNSITYVDTFSGPWENKSDNFSDTSFSIAIEELLTAKKVLKEKFGKELQINFFFVEKNKNSYEKLSTFIDKYPGLNIEKRNDELENVCEDIVNFVRSQSNGVPFIFIDPTGWTGFPMDTLQTLLDFKNVDVLINIMSIHLRRFLNHPNKENARSVEKLFGNDKFLERIEQMENEIEHYATTAREEAAVELYLQELSSQCDFPIVSRSLVLQPDKNQTYFNLVYASKSVKGLDAFKEVEKASMREMERTRVAHIQSKKHGQDDSYLFNMEEFEPPATDHYMDLRGHYISKAKDELTKLLAKEQVIDFDKIVVKTLRYPFVWMQDVNSWLRALHNDGVNPKIEFLGLNPREKTPKILKKHQIRVIDKEISRHDLMLLQ